MWNDNKDEMLCREVLLFELYQFKPRKNDARSVRERLTGIVVKYKQKCKDELNASALSPEHTWLDEALEEISEKIEEADKLHNQTTQENARNVRQDALKAQEIRQLALETLAETTKWKSVKPKS